MRELIAERLTKLVPKIKDAEWERLLQPLMETARIVEAPDDASISGVARERLREFVSKCDLMNRGENADERKALLRGLPHVIKIDGDRCVCFRGQDFVAYLKRTRSEELKGANLWFAIKSLGVFQHKVRAGESSINVWCLPVRTLTMEAIEAPEFKPDL